MAGEDPFNQSIEEDFFSEIDPATKERGVKLVDAGELDKLKDAIKKAQPDDTESRRGLLASIDMAGSSPTDDESMVLLGGLAFSYLDEEAEEE